MALNTSSRPVTGADTGPSPEPVPFGPRAYRRIVRRWGALMGLAVPGAAMVVALVLYRVSPCEGVACVENLTVWALAALALPTALLCGLPIESGALRYAVAAVTSALVWAGLGHLAAVRAGRRSLVTWRTWWAEFVWYAVGVGVGVGVGLYAIRSYAL
jgi:hypothetical protein